MAQAVQGTFSALREADNHDEVIGRQMVWPNRSVNRIHPGDFDVIVLQDVYDAVLTKTLIEKLNPHSALTQLLA